MEITYFRKGFGLKDAIEGRLTADYHSTVVERLKASDYALDVGPLRFRLAREFGFCYGVDRAVDYAYETRHKFPDRRIYLVGEIIHGSDGEFDFSPVIPNDVVIIPAFGVSLRDFERLRATGSILVDTTCGSVLNVWKRVEGYARDGYTAIIHGKHWHEETKATASQVMKHPGGRYLVVLDMDEARQVMRYIEEGGDAAPLRERFARAVSGGFEFERDLTRVGIANQTTMLSGESLAIAAEFGRTMARRYGNAALPAHFRSFDTICSATQERQDAVEALLADPPDLMITVGGYNSSNTTHLAAMVAERGVRGFHIEDASCIDPEGATIRHQPVGVKHEVVEHAWFGGARLIGITAGASTPNNKIGETIERICRTAGVPLSAALE